MVKPIHTTSEFERVVGEYSRLVFSICYTMTRDYFEAEDLTQETFVSACKHFSTFEGTNFKPWLTTIAANKCRDYLKSAARRIRVAEDSVLETLDSVPGVDDEVVERSVSERLHSMCCELREPYRSVALRHFIGQEPMSE
ncbi:MAG: sigma-70 family RNA polymerase sigma factor, partial [Clostridia bacterium]